MRNRIIITSPGFHTFCLDFVTHSLVSNFTPGKNGSSFWWRDVILLNQLNFRPISMPAFRFYWNIFAPVTNAHSFKTPKLANWYVPCWGLLDYLCSRCFKLAGAWKNLNGKGSQEVITQASETGKFHNSKKEKQPKNWEKLVVCLKPVLLWLMSAVK